MDEQEMMAVLEEASVEIDQASWVSDRPSEIEVHQSADFFVGTTETGWHFHLAAYEVPSLMGAPRRGYTGTAMKKSTIIKLPSELAKKACLMAEQAITKGVPS